jgi:acyl-CoA thioesterase-2
MPGLADRALAVAELRALLTVEKLDEDVYRGIASAEGPGRVFGGQVIAQALAAAMRSVGDDRPAHSLHAYFLRPGDPTAPIDYRVMRDFDGGSFANRRIMALQHGKPILNLAASFHRIEDGFAHQAAMPAAEIPEPEACPDIATAFAAMGRKFPSVMLDRLAAFEVHPCPPVPAQGGAPRQFLWFRLAAPMPAADTAAQGALARAVLAYASDFAILWTTALPHTTAFFTPRLQAASLDHAVWFHATPAPQDWLLYAMDSPWAGYARGFARGSIYDRRGTLVANVAQEGLLRPRPETGTPPA